MKRSSLPQTQFTFRVPVIDWQLFTLIAFKKRLSINALLREATLDTIKKYKSQISKKELNEIIDSNMEYVDLFTDNEELWFKNILRR